MSLEVPRLVSSEEPDEGQGGTNLRSTLSTVEAGVLFMRLAGKPVKGSENASSPSNISNDAKKAKQKPKGKEKKNGQKTLALEAKEGVKVSDEVANSTGEETADLYGDMDENTLSSFRELFNMLDQSNTGIITADNLYEELRLVDSEITFQEVEDVLKKVDKDGNGEIDFDEFLFHMTTMGGEAFEEGADDEKKQRYTKRRQMFYSAITQFSIKQTLADIEKTFKKQAPHVISHYSAGVRLIGLTTRQLERQMKRMQKDVKHTDSPYAKPLEFVHMGAKTLVHKKKIISQDIKSSCRDLQQEIKDKEENADQDVANLSQEIQDTMKLFEHGPNKGKLPDARIIMKLRQKIGSVTAQLRNKPPESTLPAINGPTPSPEGNTLCSPPSFPISSPKSGTFRKLPLGTRSVHAKRSILTRFNASTAKVNKCKKRNLGWTTPRIQYITVPLPCLKMKLESEKPTFNDLYRIRAKAEEAINAYYHNLRQAEIRNAWDHWDRLYADVILPKKLLENFRTVYSAYSPHREEEAFVVCPWKPGPFRYIGHMEKGAPFSLPNYPSVKSDFSGRRVKSQLDNLIVRPTSLLQNSTPSSRCSSRMT